MKECRNELKQLAQRYGIDEVILEAMVNDRSEGISEKAAVIGLRMVLSKMFDTAELFSPEDISECTGEPIETVMKTIHDQGLPIYELSSTLPGLFD